MSDPNLDAIHSARHDASNSFNPTPTGTNLRHVVSGKGAAVAAVVAVAVNAGDERGGGHCRAKAPDFGAHERHDDRLRQHRRFPCGIGTAPRALTLRGRDPFSQ